MRIVTKSQKGQGASFEIETSRGADGPVSMSRHRARSRVVVACAIAMIVLLSTHVFTSNIIPGTAAKVIGSRFDRSWSSLKKMAGLGPSTPASEAIPYPEEIPATALASFPRSGSSFTRSLFERATGFQSSSIYCDTRLLKLKAECMGLDSPFLVKTHFPLLADIDSETPHWTHFGRAVRVVRNPFDSLWSGYHFSRTGNHSAHVESIQKLTVSNKDFLSTWIVLWLEHIRYWTNEAKIPVHVVRYEDLRAAPIPTLQKLVEFLLPAKFQPELKRLTWATVDDPSKDPYWSRKSPCFSSWDKYDPEIRDWILDYVKEEWCMHDYNPLFVEATKLPAPVDCTNITSILTP